MSPWSTPTSLWTRFLESYHVISFDWFFQFRCRWCSRIPWCRPALPAFAQCELWNFFCSPLADGKNDQNLELQTVVTCEWGEVQKKSSTCADPEGWNCARLEYFFKTLITWKPRVRHKSDASQNDHSCKGYTIKTPAAALNMQKLIHCGRKVSAAAVAAKNSQTLIDPRTP